MKVRSHKHLYHFVPDYTLRDGETLISNRKLPKDEQIVIVMYSLTPDEENAIQRANIIAGRKFSPEKALEVNEKRFQDKLREKFACCCGLEIDGRDPGEIDFDTFMAEAPGEIISQFLTAVRSTETLSEGEQKNFVPESDSP